MKVPSRSVSLGHVLVAVLLVIRIPVFYSLYLAGFSNQTVGPVLDIIIYGLTIFLIILERERLSEFNMDPLAVIVIVLAKPAQTLLLPIFRYGQSTSISHIGWEGMALWGLSLTLVAALIVMRPRLPHVSGKAVVYIGVGIIVGLLYGALVGFVLRHRPIGNPQLSPSVIRSALLVGFPYHVGYAGVTEEPMFRAFLWGYLRRFRIPERWIWLIQALLFMIGHLYHISRSPLTFWVTVPVGGLVLGALAWKTRSIAPTMMAHGLWNATSRLWAIFFSTIFN